MLLAWLLAPPYHHNKTASKYDCILLYLPETWCPLCQHDFVPYNLYEMWNIINKIDYLTLKKNFALLLSPNKFIALWFVGLWSQAFALTLKPTWERFIIIVLLSWLSLRYLSRQWKNKRLAISTHYVMITYQFCCDFFLFVKLFLVQLPQYMKLGSLQNNMIICELRWNWFPPLKL